MNASLPTLNIVIATHQPEGIIRVAAMLLPAIEGVSYVVSWQRHANAPIPDALAVRPDVEIFRLDGGGLSTNRNNALDHCTADVILIADDDLILYKEGINRLRAAFAQQPDIDLATFRSEHGDMNRFPSEQVTLKAKLPKNYYVTSFEMAFRRATAGHLRYDEAYGLGAPGLQAGEEEILLITALRSGFCCRFLPITVSAHPHESTGTKTRLTKGNLMGMGAVIRREYPWTVCWRLPIKAFRVWRKKQAPFAEACRWLTAGALAAPKLKTEFRPSR